MRKRINRKIVPSALMAEIRIPEATPGIINKYALSNKQALLAKLRYNHLIDIFTGVTCYSLQSHFRATIPKIGQVEVDELYLGLDHRGAHYVFPIHATRGGEKLKIAQIEHGSAICAAKFPSFICRSIAALFMTNDIIVLLDVDKTPNGIAICSERHYRLVSPQDLI